MFKAFKYRIYPTTEQRDLLVKSFGCCRWFYNYSLNLTTETSKRTGKGLSRNEIVKLLPQLKKEKEYEWLTEPPSQVLQQVALDLSSAFLNFFEKRALYPNFKKKHQRQSIRFPQGMKLSGDYLTLPKLGKVSGKISRIPEGEFKSVTVSMTPSGEFSASCLFDDGGDKPLPIKDGKAVGIDLGITHFAITSDGTKHGNPKSYRKYEKKLAKYQKRLAKKQKGSERNRGSAITFARERDLVKNPGFCKARKVDRFFPSSKTCNHCSRLHQIGEMPLDIRSWQCPKCGTLHDRDINAAKNIKDEGLLLLEVGHTSVASGERVRPSNGTAFCEASFCEGRIPTHDGWGVSSPAQRSGEDFHD